MRVFAVAVLLALIVLGLAWELWLAPTGARSWALKVLPLTLALAGMLAQRLYTYRWLALLVWCYVAEGLVRGVSEGGIARALALAQVALALLLFGACVAHVRARQRAA
ncbi:MAG TPA: DUF2069 domain-containing protein [Burkholderiaceae bacterium]|nr:DUF2069 domain-containing protein [Burkholderiaceae bacterium]